ncbi:anti-sigma-K factor RskA [Gordonia effusa NBRC 100432]|uniref:Regulator of SigK n=1 Tax=Gordonia effusa NBRC 100432 TaxID=1077974 RepID=H0R468_9ACTN|nr:anti-sigma factor [Gordonia effusa]GAB19869.1 anti-sigma-K factor RskA [Gordonia effusa NBRC 100432]
MSDENWLDDHVELYAIDSLPSDERARAQEELANLPAARREAYNAQIVETQETMADYASRFAVAAPDDVRERVLADYAERLRSRQSEESGSASVTPIGSARRRQRLVALVAAAAVVIAAAIGAGVFIGRATAPSTQTVQADAVASVLSASDATLARGQLNDERGTLIVVTSQEQNQAVAVIRGTTNPVPTDRSLQLWLVGKSASPVSAGIVNSGSAPPLLIDQLDNTTTLAVTLEPRGGSPAPSTPLLTQVPL